MKENFALLIHPAGANLRSGHAVVDDALAIWSSEAPDENQ